MAKHNGNEAARARTMVAQEAARIIVNQGIRDYRLAKTKAAARLGFGARGTLPGNAEIERAVGEYLQLFSGDAHRDLLLALRRAALSAMRLLERFSPRLVGPVLAGTADANAAVNLHVFADSPETVSFHIADAGLTPRLYERRLKSRRGRNETYSGYQFRYSQTSIEATVFPFDGLRQAPISPIDGRPMRRADDKAVRALIQSS